MGSSLLLEYQDVLSRQSLFADCALTAEEREELLEIFMSCCTWIQTYFVWRPNLRDEADNHIVELAVAAGASHIITWNIRDFAVMELRFPALKLSTPAQFLKEQTL
jgi:predicted nucleic acid-binding protein